MSPPKIWRHHITGGAYYCQFATDDKLLLKPMMPNCKCLGVRISTVDENPMQIPNCLYAWPKACVLGKLGQLGFVDQHTL